MARSRIKGKNLSFMFDGDEYKCDLVSAVLTKDDADAAASDSVVTFCDAENAGPGGTVWYLDIEAIQSTDVDGSPDPADIKSLHTMIWNAAATQGGQTIPFTFAPYGNDVPSDAQPFFTGAVIVEQSAYPDLGGTAGENAFTWNYRFEVSNNEVTRVTTTSP